MIEIIIHSDNDIYISMKAILIPDYGGSIDIASILTYTENDKMIPEWEQAAMLPKALRRRNCQRHSIPARLPHGIFCSEAVMFTQF